MTRRFLRPPGAQPERAFQARCIRCGKCAAACAYRSIRLGGWADGPAQMGAPLVQPRSVPCYLCMKCPPACPTGALDPKLTDRRKVRMGLARLDRTRCLAFQGTLCRSCYTICPLPDEAIAMDAELRPGVDGDRCVGCGLCENACPVEPAAIAVLPREGP